MKTLRYFALLGAVLITSIFTAQAIAQEDGAPEAKVTAEESASALEEEAADNQGSDYKERLALAKEMHEIRPAADQVDSAIESVSLKMPEASRESFKSRMRNSLDYRAIERISINAMAVTYTLAELEAMVKYYSTPEAKSALEKTSVYQQKVGPEIVRMIDRAVMQMRTGGAN